MKELAKAVLKWTRLYGRVKVSSVYDWYWKIADPQVLEGRQREVEFYRILLEGFRKGDLIFDIGANEGYKTDIFLRLGAKVVAVEPDETCQEILRQSFLAYRIGKKSVVIVGKAVSEEDSVRTMWIDSPGSAKNTLSEKWTETLRNDADRFGQPINFRNHKKVETTNLEQLVKEHGVPFFIKIDVEGHEVNVLRGLGRPIPYLSFEVNLPEFREEGMECVSLLARLNQDYNFNYVADCKDGLALQRWLDSNAFSTLLGSCNEKSIEVICRGSIHARAKD